MLSSMVIVEWRMVEFLVLLCIIFHRELQEETGISSQYTENLRPVDSLAYAHVDPEGKKGYLQTEGLFVYDIELPVDTLPRVNDGEAQCFYLMSVDEVGFLCLY